MQSPSTPNRTEPRAARTSTDSRRAGALLLGAIVVVIVVAVVLISSGGGKGSTPTTTATTGTSSTPTSTSSTSSKSSGKPSLDKTIQLSSSEPSLNASGTAYVLSEGSRRAFYVTAQGLPPSSGFFYAVWLYNSPSSAEPLGRASNVTSNGRMNGGNPLPSSAGDYAKFIVTRETSSHPSHPGPIVLSGPFALH
jgi:Anti-sigma-K factor rskA